MHTNNRQNTDNLRGKIVWGIRVKPPVKRRWQRLALTIGVPVNKLIEKALSDWIDSHAGNPDNASAQQNFSQVLADEEWELPESLTDEQPTGVIEETLPDERVNLSIRGVKVSTRLHLKAISISTGEKVYRLIDMMVARAWQDIGNEPVPEEKDGRLNRFMGKFMHKMFSRH